MASREKRAQGVATNTLWMSSTVLPGVASTLASPNMCDRPFAPTSGARQLIRCLVICFLSSGSASASQTWPWSATCRAYGFLVRMPLRNDPLWSDFATKHFYRKRCASISQTATRIHSQRAAKDCKQQVCRSCPLAHSQRHRRGATPSGRTIWSGRGVILTMHLHMRLYAL